MPVLLKRMEWKDTTSVHCWAYNIYYAQGAATSRRHTLGDGWRREISPFPHCLDTEAGPAPQTKPHCVCWTASSGCERHVDA